MSVEAPDVTTVPHGSGLVADAPPAPARLTPETVPVLTLKMLEEAASGGVRRELFEHFEPEIGGGVKFIFRALTGADVDRANELAKDKPHQLGMWLSIIALVEPKIGMAEWAMLNKLKSGIKARLLKEVFERSGMTDEAMDLSKKFLSAMGDENSSGTD